MSADFCCGDESRLVQPYPVRMEDASRPERCRMADTANWDINEDSEDKMADAEGQRRVLQYIVDMCLDRPCPKCRSEVIDRPQDDLRQCRACGELWGFDDTQSMDEFVREFGRMEPCRGCGADGLDDFQVTASREGHALVCLRCKTVQETRPPVDRGDRFEPLDMQDRGGGELGAGGFNGAKDVKLSCPNCPDMTGDFFAKTFERDVMVRAVCPACSHVVFDRTVGERETGTANGKPEFDRAFGGVGRNFLVRMFTAPAPAPPERNEDNLGADHLFPRMGEEVGMTVGTAMGNIILRDRDQANVTGTVGAIVGKSICKALYRSAARIGLTRP